MPINSSIAMGVRPMEIQGPADQYGKMLTLQHLANQAQTGELALQDAQTARQDKTKIADLYRNVTKPDGTVDDTAFVSGLAAGGMGSKIPEYLAAAAKRKTDAATLTKTMTGIQADKAKMYKDNIPNDPAGAAQWLTAQYQDPDLGPFMAKLSSPEQAIQRIPKTPAEFAQWRQQAGLGMEKAITIAETARHNLRTEGLTAEGHQVSRENNRATVGASLANAGATREIAKATRDAANTQRDQATEMKLADDYRAQSKDFKAVGDAYKQISATLDKATTSPAATLAAATKFMKLLDPGSVVRESELGMALAATGVFDRAANYVNTLKYGKVLTPDQAKDFKNITQQIYGAARAGQQQVDASYKKQAETYKLRPEMVIQDLGQNTPAGGGSPIDSLLDKYK